MICRACQTEIDDDLIFCTNCGARLFEAPAEEPTVLMTEPVYTTPPKAKPRKASSNLKWLALIVALIAVPASIFGVYLLSNAKRSPQITRNANRPGTPSATPTRRSNTNQNSNVGAANVNANRTNANANVNAANTPLKNQILNERIEIAPRSHFAKPFAVETETARIRGKVQIAEGRKIDGYVYLKKNFDEHFPDENYKVFSFGTSTAADIRQTLVEEEYVLVFVNNSENPVVIESSFSLEN